MQDATAFVVDRLVLSKHFACFHLLLPFWVLGLIVVVPVAVGGAIGFLDQVLDLYCSHLAAVVGDYWIVAAGRQKPCWA